jgi:hypothetical protein
VSENKDPKELWNEFNTIEVEELLNYTTASLINEVYRLSSENEKENLQKETDLSSMDYTHYGKLVGAF